MVIAYCIIKSTDTNPENVLFNSFFHKNNYSNVPRYYVISILLVFWAFSVLFVRRGAVCILLRYSTKCLTFNFYVICWSILWHTSVNLFSFMTYCEQYCNCLFRLIIRWKMCITFWIWNQVNLRHRMQTIRSVLSVIEKINLHFCGNLLLSSLLTEFFLNSFIFLSLPSDCIQFYALLKTVLANLNPLLQQT